MTFSISRFIFMVLFPILLHAARRANAFRPLHLSTIHALDTFPKSRYPFFRNSFALFSTTANSILNGLNDAQVDAVTQPLSSITRVVAGPGAGKTRVLTCRIAHLLYNDPDNKILAVTFTKKAAGEMQHRLHKILEDAAGNIEDTSNTNHLDVYDSQIIAEVSVGQPKTPIDRVTLGTFHSVCARVLRWNGKQLDSLPTIRKEMIGPSNLDGSFAIADQNEQLRIIKDCLDELKIDLKKEKEMKPITILTTVGKIKALHAVNEWFTDKELMNRAVKIAIAVYPSYRTKLFSTNSMDFDDLIFFTRELLDVHPDIRNALQKRWHHVLVDEFQDTSKVQLDLVRLLTSQSLLVVGDADQSIYSWRGAAVESMSDFENEFKQYHSNGVKTVYLMENYRSTSNIVNAAQKIISAETNKGSVPSNNMRQDMKPMRGTGATPRVLACADAKAEANFVVHTIQQMIESQQYKPDNTIAIIYRTNVQSRAIEEACVLNNLPYVVRGSAGAFYNRQEIKDCLCFLRWIYNGQDRASMMRAVKTPAKGIGEKALEEFIAYCNAIEEYYVSAQPDLPKPTPLDVLLSLTDGQGTGEDIGIVPDAPISSDVISKRFLNKLVAFSRQMRMIKHYADSQSISELISTIVDIVALKAHFDSISKTTAEFGDRWSNVEELRQAAEKYTAAGSAMEQISIESTDDDQVELYESPLGNFLDDVALVADIGNDGDDEVEGEPRLKANLMTIHASKGMEFDAVFIVGNEDGTLPSQRAIQEGEGSVELDEERRLCYVAMTRAKNDLVMTWRREVSFFSDSGFRTAEKCRSRFLDVLVGKSTKSSSTEGQRQPFNSRQFNLPTLKNPAPTFAQSSSSRPSPFSSMKTTNTTPFNGTRKMSTLQSPQQFDRTEPIVPRSKVPTSSVEPKRPSDIQAYLPTKPTSSSVNKAPTTQASLHAMAKAPKTPEAKRSTVVQAYLPTTPAARKSQQASSSAPSPTSSSRRTNNMDSTWFYPVGSSVRHKQLGEGKVLAPPPDQNGEMMVRVKFLSDRVEDIPAMGPDLLPF